MSALPFLSRNWYRVAQLRPKLREHAELTPSYGNHDAGVCCRMFGARTLALLGRANEARQMSEDAVRLATELQHPFTLALALFFASTVYQALRETQNAARRAAEAIALSRDHGFLLAEAWAMAISGWAAVADGDARMGAALIRQGIDAAIGSGSGAFVPHHLGLLAEAQLLGGELDEGIVSVDEALRINTINGAYNSHEEAIKGSITAGKLADLQRRVDEATHAFGLRPERGLQLFPVGRG